VTPERRNGLPTAVGGARCGVRESARQSRRGPGSSVEFVDTELTDEPIRRLCLLWQRSVLETDDQNRFGGLVETDYDDLSDHLSDVELALRQALARSSPCILERLRVSAQSAWDGISQSPTLLANRKVQASGVSTP
jgi:hypothetical protein